jgi:hypothetical protein
MVLTLRILWQPICGRRRGRGRGRKKNQKKRNQRRGTKRKEIDQLIMMRRQIELTSRYQTKEIQSKLD